MRWITREHVKVDRVACPWLIAKFVDAEAEFLFARPEKVHRIRHDGTYYRLLVNKEDAATARKVLETLSEARP